MSTKRKTVAELDKDVRELKDGMAAILAALNGGAEPAPEPEPEDPRIAQLAALEDMGPEMADAAEALRRSIEADATIGKAKRAAGKADAKRKAEKARAKFTGSASEMKRIAVDGLIPVYDKDAGRYVCHVGRDPKSRRVIIAAADRETGAPIPTADTFTDRKTGEARKTTYGFRKMGYIPDAALPFLAQVD